MGKTELTEKFDRRENLRGTALTIMGGGYFGDWQECLENILLYTEE